MNDLCCNAAARTTRFLFGAALVLAIATLTAQVQAQASPPAAPIPPAAAAPAAGAPAPGAQQAPPAAQEGETQTIKVGVNEVDLVFTVTDKKGHFIKGLNLSDFGLLDNRMQPEKVLHFQQQTDLPLRVGIMLDTSTSIRGRFQFEQQSAVQFLMQAMHRNDRAFVEGFDVNIELTQSFTNNIDQLDQGISRLRPGGGTALFDALYSTCKDQMLTLRESGVVRKVLVLVSDGDDDYSHAIETDAIKECQRAETIVYAISTNVSPSRDKGDDVLQQISDATGGRAFYPRRIEEVANGFTSIEEELRNQYLLEYLPANFKQDGSFRTIYLQARNPAYKVRAHTGYFAPKASE
jgi:VWFA-related protein